MSKTKDIIIIGAGIMGLSTAWQLARRSDCSVVVLERGAAPGEGSSGASSAICRHLYSHPELIEIARDSISAYRHWSDFLETDDAVGEYQAIGALWLATADKQWRHIDQTRLTERGIPASLLSDDDVRERFPSINPCVQPIDLQTGEATGNANGGTHLIEESAGYMDPQNALTDLVTDLRARGVTVRFNSHVGQVLMEGQKAIGVELQDGTRLHAGIVLNASGPWCNPILDGAGLSGQWPLKPTRIQMVHLNRPPEVVGPLPVCVDMATGIYFRPQSRGQQIILGSTREEDERETVSDPDEYNRLPDDEFVAIRLHALQQLIPAMSNLISKGAITGYCGLYTVNHTDIHPVLGKTPIDGFMVANGFSGHGFKLGPGVGAMLAREITGVELAGDPSVPVEFLSWFRDPIQLEARNVLA